MLNRSLALNPKAESFICCNMKASLDTKKQRSIALYGGSFDPVHRAHLEVARTALENCDIDAVIFIPTAQSPLKKNAAIASDADRLEMLRLATAEESRFEVDTYELERGGTSYTVDTVKAYQTAHEGCRLHWIIGADQFELLSQWRRIEDIASLVTFIVFRRPGHSIVDSAVKGLRFLIIDAPLMQHSSTEIRTLIAEGCSSADLLPPAVEAFICARELYTR
jgi:nicotinate-nucleotide adenylyltransferase